jgi:predicted dehydrogenase
LKTALVGCGYWGAAISRTIARLCELQLVSVYDRDAAVSEPIARSHGAVTATSLERTLDGDSEAAIIATPPETHYELARRCLEAGKHVFVEKPFTTSLEHAQALLRLADRKGLICMVDHTYVYAESFRILREMVDGGELGEIVYLTSRRINLGIFQYFTDVIWDLAVHDLAVIDYLFGLDIDSVQVSAMKYNGFPKDAMANITLDLKSGVHANLAVSWLSPVKVRETVIGGTDRMAVYDDTKGDKLLLFDKGVVLREELDSNDLVRQMAEYRYGDTAIVPLANKPPLSTALKHFAECVQTGGQPLTGAGSILSVMKALDAISTSRESPASGDRRGGRGIDHCARTDRRR